MPAIDGSKSILIDLTIELPSQNNHYANITDSVNSLR